MNICLICLRSDRKIKLNTRLSEFHDELCGLTVLTNSFYCGECEYLMTKLYKFKRKCVKASEIYRDWISGEIKDQIQDLYKLLPPSSLGVWKSKSKTIAYVSIQPTETQPNCIEEVTVNPCSTIQELLEDSFIEEIKAENEPIYSESIDSNENIQNDIPQSLPESDCDDDEKNNYIVTEYPIDKREPVQIFDDCLIFDAVGRDVTDIKNESDTSKNKEVGINENVPNSDKDNEITIDKNHTSTGKKRKIIISKNEISTGKKRKTIISKKETSTGKKRKNITNKNDPSIPKTRNVKKKKCSDWFPNERLKDELFLKLSLFGVIVTDDGITVDKELINKFMQHDAGATLLESFWNATSLNDILILSPDIRQALTTINSDQSTKNLPEFDIQSIFDVEYLTTHEMRVQEFERRKTYECYLKAKYKCEVCYQVLRGPLHLESHINTYHDRTGDKWPCPICNMRLPKGGRARRSHNDLHGAVFKCKLCPLVTYNRNTVKEHAGKHQGKTYRCDQCDVTYKCMSAYYSHVAQCHGRRGSVCATCGRGFRSGRALSVHTALAHKDAPPPLEEENVRCNECDVTFPSRAVLAAHARHVHAPAPNVRPPRPAGDLPGFMTKTRPSQIEPTSKNTKRSCRQQKCRVCGVSRAGSGWLRAHFRHQHPAANYDLLYSDTKMHLCHVCGAGMTSIYTLRDHMTLHSGAPLACELCPGRFRTPALLANHRRTHFPPTLPCTHCGKMFKTRSNLYNHTKGHNTQRNHKCHLCEKSFLHSAALNEHIRGVHNNVRRVRGSNREGAGKETPTKVKRAGGRAKRGKRTAESDECGSDDNQRNEYIQKL